MTAQEVSENKISRIRKYLDQLQTYQSIPLGKLSADLTVRAAVERYLYLAIQSTIELAEAIIAERGYRKPTTLAEVFEILGEKSVIKPQLQDRLISMAKFRNLVAHEYEKMDYSIVYDILQNRLKDIEEFIAVVGN